MKKKKKNKHHHHPRLIKQKSNHSYATAGDIANLKTILSPVEDEDEEHEGLLKKQSEHAAINAMKHTVAPKLNHNSSMSTPLIH